MSRKARCGSNPTRPAKQRIQHQATTVPEEACAWTVPDGKKILCAALSQRGKAPDVALQSYRSFIYDYLTKKESLPQNSSPFLPKKNPVEPRSGLEEEELPHHRETFCVPAEFAGSAHGVFGFMPARSHQQPEYLE